MKKNIATDNLKGIYLSILGVVAFGFMDVSAAYLARLDYPISEIMFMRSLWAFLPTFIFLGIRGEIRAVHTKRLHLHLTRGLSGVIAMGLIFYSYRVNEMSTAVALWFSSPIFVTLIGTLFLKEKIGVRRWSAVLVGFVGVLIVASPTHMTIYMVFPLLAALVAAISVIQVKMLGKTEPSGVVAFYFTLFSCVGAALWGLCFESWSMPATSWHATLFFLIGIFGGVGQITTVAALAVAETSVIMPFRYLSLIWTTFLAFVLFNEIPALHVLIGASFIMMAGLYTVYREMFLIKKSTVTD